MTEKQSVSEAYNAEGQKVFGASEVIARLIDEDELRKSAPQKASEPKPEAKK